MWRERQLSNAHQTTSKRMNGGQEGVALLQTASFVENISQGRVQLTTKLPPSVVRTVQCHFAWQAEVIWSTCHAILSIRQVQIQILDALSSGKGIIIFFKSKMMILPGWARICRGAATRLLLPYVPALPTYSTSLICTEESLPYVLILNMISDV